MSNVRALLMLLPSKFWRCLMEAVHDGQCGLCTHFGESHAKSNVLVSILTSKTADTVLVDECGHPKLIALHLKVTPISGCDGFVPAAAA
jgi:hypothetical protein